MGTTDDEQQAVQWTSIDKGPAQCSSRFATTIMRHVAGFQMRPKGRISTEDPAGESPVIRENSEKAQSDRALRHSWL
jgi:hypothetical protein